MICWNKTFPSVFPHSTISTYFHLVDLLLKGKVAIHAKPGMKLEIPDGVVLENEVRATHIILIFYFLFLFFTWMNVLNSQNVLWLLCSQDIKDPSDL